MKLRRVDQVAVFYEPAPARRIKVGRLTLTAREILFEYDAGFLGSKLELSPVKLPLGPGVMAGRPDVLRGLMGVFDDSLGGGWGKQLILSRAAALGIPGSVLTPLDRLILVGDRSMGALSYEPEGEVEDPALAKLAEVAQDAETVLSGEAVGELEQLVAAARSPKGPRPKVLVQLAPNGDVHVGARSGGPGLTAWLVKLPGPEDNPHAASLEHAYALMAKAAKVQIPRTQLLGRTSKTPGLFAIERFDRDGATPIHTHTLGGLLNVPHAYTGCDYGDLLKVTRQLTRDDAAVAEMFRRACFNVLAHIRDDHTRNFSFLMDETGRWRPSPAYDLMFARGPDGQHTMLVAGEGLTPGADHLRRLARNAGLEQPDRILDEVRAATARFAAFADEAGVPAALRGRIAGSLAKG